MRGTDNDRDRKPRNYFGDDIDDTIFDDEPPASPLGRLMDDEIGDDEPRAYVSGYSRNEERAVSYFPDPDEEPEVEIHEDRNMRERPEVRRPERSDDRRARRERFAPPPVEEDDNAELDDYERGRREAMAMRTRGNETREEVDQHSSERPSDTRRRERESRERENREGMERPNRERRRTPNPAPRPAMAAGTPTQRRMTQPPPRRHEDERDRDDRDMRDEQPINDDDISNFRGRYSPDELISSSPGRDRDEDDNPRGGERPARPPRQPAPRGAAPRTAPAHSDSANPARFVIAGVALVFLAVLIGLTANRASLNRQLNYANQRVYDMDTRYNWARGVEANLQAYRNTNATQSATITDLENQLAEARAANTPYYTPGAGTTINTGDDNGITEVPPPPVVPTDTLPATHVVGSGDNFTRIAIMFYGRGTASQNHLRAEFIAEYNGININNPQLGQSITIPVLPEHLQ